MQRALLSGWLVSLGSCICVAAGDSGPATRGALREHYAAVHGPALIVDGADRDALSISAREIKVLIDGFRAQTTLTITFHNDANRVLEGEFVFPLPEGATVSGYGLDVNGQMVDGVAVEKQAARVSYEQEVRRKIDPGLLEQTAGNNFRTRVYPIPASGTRTVKVQYVTSLQGTPGNLLYTQLLDWNLIGGESKVHVEVIGGIAPVDRGDSPAHLEFQKRGDRFVAERSFENKAMPADLVIACAEPAESVRVERDQRTFESFDEYLPDARHAAALPEYYFAIDAQPPAAAKREAIAPHRIGIYWDASMSREAVDKSREVGLLKALLTRLGKVQIDLTVFRNTLEPPRRFSIRGGDPAALLDALTAIKYDGGTRLDSLYFPKLAPAPAGAAADAASEPYDYWLLFSDGISDLGSGIPGHADVPVYSVCNDSRANHTLLRYVANLSGGEYLNLLSLSDEQALGAIGAQPFSLISVECKPEEIADVYPRGVQPVQGRITVSGKLIAAQATLTLHFGFGQTETSRRTFTLQKSNATAGGLVAMLWANMKVSELALFPEQNKDELLRIGRQFNLATPMTSLLVLETPQQYALHHVVPPANRPEVVEQFAAAIRNERVAVKKSQEERIQNVLTMWNDRVKWWEEKHEYRKDLKVAPDAQVAEITEQAAATGPRGPVFGHGGNGRREAHAAGGRPSFGDRSNQPDAAAASTPAPSGRPTSPVVVGGISGVAAGGERSRADDAPARDGERAALLRVTNDPSFRGGPGDDGGGVFVPTPSTQPAGEAKGGDAVVAIKEWDPQTPYLAAMKASGDGAYAVFIQQRRTFGNSPAFYLDCADFFLRANQRELGIRVLTDVAELRLDDARLLRIVAYRLSQLGEHEAAIDLFEKVRAMRPEEPQSHRDLALALAARADGRLASPAPGASFQGDAVAAALSDYRRSLELLNQVIAGQWERFEGIQVVALMEANRIYSRARALSPDLASPIDQRLMKLLDLDLRVVLTWDTDATDVDLWVTEPSGEKCFYQHNRTTIGGLLSRDMTDGYGPEEYCLRKLMPGKYLIQACFYGSHNQSLVGPSSVQATVITHFGRPDEKRQSMTLRLTDNKQIVDVGTVSLGQEGPAAK